MTPVRPAGPGRPICRWVEVALLAAAALLLLGIVAASFLPPSIVLGRDAVVFGAEEGGAATTPQKVPIVIRNKAFGAHRDLLWKARPRADWLVVRPAFGTGAGDIVVRPLDRRLAPGTYRTTIAVACAGARNSPREVAVVLNVFRKGAAAPPFGWLDFPANGATVRGGLDVWGWALDDIEVTEVVIKREPFPKETAAAVDADGLVPVGRAKLLAGARPDVEKAFPRFPMNARAGFWFTFPDIDIPPEAGGRLTIHAVIADKEGGRTDLNAAAVTWRR